MHPWLNRVGKSQERLLTDFQYSPCFQFHTSHCLVVHNISESWGFIGLSGCNSLLLISISKLRCFYLFYSFTRISVAFGEATEINVFNLLCLTGSSPSYSSQLLLFLQGACLNVPRLHQETFLCSPMGSSAWLYHSSDQTLLNVSISMPASPCRFSLLAWGCVLVMSTSPVPSIWSTVVQSKYEVMRLVNKWRTVRMNQNSQRAYLEREISWMQLFLHKASSLKVVSPRKSVFAKMLTVAWFKLV